MLDIFWRYMIVYLLPILGLLAAYAPDIQIYPKIVVMAEYQPKQISLAFTWMVISVIILYPVHYMILNKGDAYIISDLIWGIIYSMVVWKIGPYLGKP